MATIDVEPLKVKFLEDNTIIEGFRFSDMEHDNSDPIALKMV